MEFGGDSHTFVVCAYKESPFLEGLIKSLERQTVASAILVSTSTPSDFIEGICERHGLDLFINDGESSISHDWNFGYDHAETPLVTIAHQDDRYEPRFVESTLRTANSVDSDVGVFHTDYYEIRDGQRVENNRLLRIKRRLNAHYAKTMLAGKPEAKRKAFRFGNFVCCPSVTLAKNVVGSSVFDTKYRNSCDYRTWLKLAEEGIGFAYVPEKLMGHRIYEESTTSLNIGTSVRAHEDREIMQSLWPRPIANVVFAAYSQSEKSNDVNAT